MKAREQASSRVGPLLLTIIFITCIIQVEAQFFTKSSKSIPRMGRRSSETAYSANRYRRLLIDTLIDEYGPNLLQALEIQARAAGSSKVVEQDLPGGEVAYRNEQPFDWKRSSEDEATETRDERSDSGRDSSLAMRALNANRYIQYLTSGQPLMSYSRLFGTQEGDTAANGRDTIARENQNRLFANDR